MENLLAELPTGKQTGKAYRMTYQLTDETHFERLLARSQSIGRLQCLSLAHEAEALKVKV